MNSKFDPTKYGFIKCADELSPKWKLTTQYVEYMVESNCDFVPYYIFSCNWNNNGREILYQGDITPDFATLLFKLFKYRKSDHIKETNIPKEKI